MTAAPPLHLPPANPEAAQALFSELGARASAAGIALRTPPAEPTTCCGRGCNGCVWEGWYAAAQYWCEEAALKLEAAGPDSRSSPE